MKDAVLIQQIYPDTEGVKLLELTQKRHSSYCEKWQMTYWCKYENSLPESDPLKGSWAKVKLIQQALNDGYYYIIWLDADTIIHDFETDLRIAIEPRRIGACWHRIPQLNHWNVGALYLDNSSETLGFIEKWLASYPPPMDGWFEQGVFNRLAREGRVVSTLSDKWNSTLDVSMVPDAVVLGFHGQGTAENRYEIMKRSLDLLAAKESAKSSPADGAR